MKVCNCFLLHNGKHRSIWQCQSWGMISWLSTGWFQGIPCKCATLAVLAQRGTHEPNHKSLASLHYFLSPFWGHLGFQLCVSALRQVLSLIPVSFIGGKIWTSIACPPLVTETCSEASVVQRLVERGWEENCRGLVWGWRHRGSSPCCRAGNNTVMGDACSNAQF